MSGFVMAKKLEQQLPNTPTIKPPVTSIDPEPITLSGNKRKLDEESKATSAQKKKQKKTGTLNTNDKPQEDDDITMDGLPRPTSLIATSNKKQRQLLPFQPPGRRMKSKSHKKPTRQNDNNTTNKNKKKQQPKPKPTLKPTAAAFIPSTHMPLEMQRKDNELKRKDKELDHLRNIVIKANKLKQEAAQKASKFLKKLNERTKELEAIKTQKQKTINDYEKLEQQNMQQEQQIKSLDKEIREIRILSNEFKNEINKKNIKINELISHANELSADLDEERRQIYLINSEISSLKDDILNLKKINNELQSQLDNETATLTAIYDEKMKELFHTLSRVTTAINATEYDEAVKCLENIMKEMKPEQLVNIEEIKCDGNDEWYEITRPTLTPTDKRHHKYLDCIENNILSIPTLNYEMELTDCTKVKGITNTLSNNKMILLNPSTAHHKFISNAFGHGLGDEDPNWNFELLRPYGQDNIIFSGLRKGNYLQNGGWQIFASDSCKEGSVLSHGKQQYKATKCGYGSSLSSGVLYNQAHNTNTHIIYNFEVDRKIDGNISMKIPLHLLLEPNKPGIISANIATETVVTFYFPPSYDHNNAQRVNESAGAGYSAQIYSPSDGILMEINDTIKDKDEEFYKIQIILSSYRRDQENIYGMSKEEATNKYALANINKKIEKYIAPEKPMQKKKKKAMKILRRRSNKYKK